MTRRAKRTRAKRTRRTRTRAKRTRRTRTRAKRARHTQRGGTLAFLDLPENREKTLAVGLRENPEGEYDDVDNVPGVYPVNAQGSI
jgi:hypothetical protein